MRATLLMSTLLFTGCPYEDEEERTCEDVSAEFTAEAEAIRSCEVAADCGIDLAGTSCGCTRNWVARADADTTTFYDLIDEAAEAECDLGLASTCDCPAADGFDCVEGVCTWDYITESDTLPACAAADGDDYDLEGARVEGDTLYAELAFSGGCADHDFTLCWPDQAFMESWPVQAALEIQHEDNDDACDGWLYEERAFDLVPLQQAWRAEYGGGDGEIVVRLGALSLSYEF